MTLEKLARNKGLEISELKKKCVRLGINPNCYITKENEHTLSTYISYEGKMKFEILPSKMNS